MFIKGPLSERTWLVARDGLLKGTLYRGGRVVGHYTVHTLVGYILSGISIVITDFS